MNGQKSGKGFLKFANGDYYEGNFQEGKLHGKGNNIFMKGLIIGEILEDTKEIGRTT